MSVKNLNSPQQLRNTKFPRKYEIIKRYLSNNYVVENGGWHFSYILKTDEILKKVKGFAIRNIIIVFLLIKKKIEQKIKDNQDIYDRGYIFRKYEDGKLPGLYKSKNKEKFNEYLIE